jgi:hypothetical protein
MLRSSVKEEGRNMYDREIETRNVLQRYPKGGVAPLRSDLERYNDLERRREWAATSSSAPGLTALWGTLAKATTFMTTVFRRVGFLIRRTR